MLTIILLLWLQLSLLLMPLLILILLPLLLFGEWWVSKLRCCCRWDAINALVGDGTSELFLFFRGSCFSIVFFWVGGRSSCWSCCWSSSSSCCIVYFLNHSSIQTNNNSLNLSLSPDRLLKMKIWNYNRIWCYQLSFACVIECSRWWWWWCCCSS